MQLKAQLSDVRTTLSRGRTTLSRGRIALLRRRTALLRRRTVRTAQRRLAEELAAFASAADRVELEQILDRHAAEETREIRSILARRDIALVTTARRR